MITDVQKNNWNVLYSVINFIYLFFHFKDCFGIFFKDFKNFVECNIFYIILKVNILLLILVINFTYLFFQIKDCLTILLILCIYFFKLMIV